MKYEFHPEAEQEFLAAAIRYESDVTGLGERFGEELFRVIQLLLENPELGAAIDSELRHFVLRRFPFSVVYAILPGLLYIVAIAHGSREPDYWQLRVDR